MEQAAPVPSLLQSIRAGPKIFKRNLRLTPRQVDNAKENTSSLAKIDVENKSSEQNTCVSKEDTPPNISLDSNNAPNVEAPQQPAKKLKSMASKSFYKVDALRVNDVEERVLRFLAQLRGRAKAGGKVATLWQQFPTQQAAFDFADQNDPSGEHLRTFSVELASTGTRRFLVTSPVEFWRRYEAMLPYHRHYYEIIRQGWPCHLYLDLEFSIVDNPTKDGQMAVDAVVSLLREEAQNQLGVHLEDSGILELDSSTETKFSRHLIIRLPGAAFATNIHIGAFIQSLCKRAQEERALDPRCGALFVKKGDVDDACFIDTGVYTRNRAFRLHLSSKAGKNAVLMPTRRYGTSGLRPERIFMDALICNVTPEARLIRCFDESSGDAAAAATAAAGRASARAGRGLSRGSGALLGSDGTTVPHMGPSPYPDIDAFIASVCSNLEGGPGSIRSWVSLDDGAVLLYNIKGNRYCGNIGRQHRSNGVFYVVDLEQGVWYQKCYDPDCRAYRSPVTPLPEELVRNENNQKQSDEAEERRNENVELISVGIDVWGDDAEAEEWDAAAVAAVTAAETAAAFL